MAPATPFSRSNGLTQPMSLPADSSSIPVARRTRSRHVETGITHTADSRLLSASPSKAGNSTWTTSRKRKATSPDDVASTSKLPPPTENAYPGSPLAKAKDTRQKKSKTSAEDTPETRLRKFRERAPKSFLEKLHRAQTQRMIVIGRVRSSTETSPQEDIDIVGSTGNIYRVTIGATTACTCPDHRKGHECKHKVYALHTVLKAPEHLQYQLAFLPSELQEIFAHAPPLPTDVASSGDTDGHRKPVEGECPICYMDLDEKANEIVWCRAACGNNLHQICFEQWAVSQRGTTVRCVYCRAPWQTDPGDIQNITKAAEVTDEGYMNVAEQFGMSRARDYSTYHQPWARRQFGMGW